MGNSINRSENQIAHEQPANTNPNVNANTNRIRFSESLSSLSNFTSKFLFRSRRSYSLSTIDPIPNERPSKTSHQVIRRILHFKSYLNFMSSLTKSNKLIRKDAFRQKKKNQEQTK